MTSFLEKKKSRAEQITLSMSFRETASKTMVGFWAKRSCDIHKLYVTAWKKTKRNVSNGHIWHTLQTNGSNPRIKLRCVNGVGFQFIAARRDADMTFSPASLSLPESLGGILVKKKSYNAPHRLTWWSTSFFSRSSALFVIIYLCNIPTIHVVQLYLCEFAKTFVILMSTSKNSCGGPFHKLYPRHQALVFSQSQKFRTDFATASVTSWSSNSES